MNLRKNDNNEQIMFLIIGLIAIVVLVLIVILNPNLLATEKGRNIYIMIGIAFVFGIWLLSFITKVNKRSILVKKYRQALMNIYGNDITVNKTYQNEIVAGDKSKEGTIRKNIFIEMNVPKYNCNVRCYKLQQSTSYHAYSSQETYIDYKYVDIAYMLDFRYKLPNNNFDLSNPKLIEIINTLKKTRTINVDIQNNYLIIEKTENTNLYTDEDILSDINDIKIFYDQIFSELTPGGYKNTNSELQNKIAMKQVGLDIASPSFESFLLAMGFLVFGIAYFILKPNDYITAIIGIACGLIFLVVYFICTKIDITLGKFPIIIGSLIIIILFKNISNYQDITEFKNNVDKIESIFNNKKFNYEENVEYEVKNGTIQKDGNFIYRFSDESYLFRGYVIYADGKIKYTLEEGNACIYKDYNDSKYTYISDYCDF